MLVDGATGVHGDLAAAHVLAESVIATDSATDRHRGMELNFAKAKL